MVNTVSVNFFHTQTPHYSTEQAMSMMMDDQSLNELAADSDSREVFARSVDTDFLHDEDADSTLLPDDSDTKHIYELHLSCIPPTVLHQKFLILKE